MGSEYRAVPPTHHRYIDDASATSAMRRRCSRGTSWAPHRAASPMHRKCGAILRPHLFGPHL
eukprot:9485677-Pyramimonas_sp.AAC.1